MDDLPLPFTQRLTARQWTVVDVTLAVFLAGASVAVIALRHSAIPSTKPVQSVLAYVSVAVICGSLPYRRRSPMVVLGAIVVGLASLCALSGLQPALLALLPAAYSVASTSSPWTSLRAVGAAVVAVEVGAIFSVVVPRGNAVLAVLACAAIGWLAGVNAQSRQIYMAAMLDRASERERERQQQARRAGAEERLRIARELHDVVAHAMSIIAVRSGVARMVLDVRPEEAAEALGIIEETSRQALQELRLLVGVLRGDDTERMDGGRNPAPGLADLEDLVCSINEAGVSVGVHVEGKPRRLGPGTDLSAYRIVQEALTNVVRHAAPARAELTIRYRPSEVVIEVTDDGCLRPRAGSPTLSDPTAGHGIVGMRERVAVYGGGLVAEPTSSGFRILAHIPTEEVCS